MDLFYSLSVKSIHMSTCSQRLDEANDEEELLTDGSQVSTDTQSIRWRISGSYLVVMGLEQAGHTHHTSSTIVGARADELQR